MKAMLAAILLLPTLQPALGQTAQNAPNSAAGGTLAVARVDGTRIPSVTVTNLTQTSVAIARNYFIAAGVDLGPPAPIPAATPASGVIVVMGTPLELLRLQRQQLASEQTRLARVIAQKRRSAQPAPAESSEWLALNTVLQKLDREIAALRTQPGPSEALSSGSIPPAAFGANSQGRVEQ